MLRFTKSFINNSETKIASNFNKIDDLKKLGEIRKNLHPIEQKNENEINICNNGDIYKDIHKDRINAINSIKKD